MKSKALTSEEWLVHAQKLMSFHEEKKAKEIQSTTKSEKSDNLRDHASKGSGVVAISPSELALAKSSLHIKVDGCCDLDETTAKVAIFDPSKRKRTN